MLTLTILGNNSALPAFGRHPTSQVLSNGSAYILIDCGEGTQIQLTRYQIKINKLSHIFISHLHGDHFYGLIGLINTMALMNRTQDLYLYAVPELLPIIDIQLNVSSSVLPFQLHFIPLLEEGFLTKVDNIKVFCFYTNHRIRCFGFVFKEMKNLRKINANAVAQHHVPFSYFENLQKGEDFINIDGVSIANGLLTEPNKNSISYAFAADTLYDESIIPHIKNIDCLYHEATYLEDKIALAKERYHSTAKQAAAIAVKANVGKLLIGHFSSRYKALEPFLEEAKQVFEHTQLAIEGERFEIE